jgi:hypothetical protein
MRFFFFGLLSDLDILELVIDRPAPGKPFPPARLADHRLVRMWRETFPMLVPASGVHVPGVIVDDLSEADVERILFFESVEYEPTPIAVLSEGGRVDAHAFATTARAVADQEPWTFEDWRRRFKAHDLRAARVWMALYGHLDVAEADRLWDEAVAAGRPFEDVVDEIVCGAARRTGTKRS